MAYDKVDKSFMDTPVEELCGDPDNHKGGAGSYDGEPGYDKRTGGMLPEKNYDDLGGQAPKKG